MRLKMKNRSLRYDINGPKSRPGQKYTRYKSASVKWCLYVLNNG